MIAETLLDKETITAEEIEALCKTGKLPVQETPAPEAPAEPAEAPAEPTEPAIPDVAESPEPKDPDGAAGE